MIPDCKQQLLHSRAQHVGYGLAMGTVATHSLTSTGSTNDKTSAGALNGDGTMAKILRALRKRTTQSVNSDLEERACEDKVQTQPTGFPGFHMLKSFYTSSKAAAQTARQSVQSR